MPHDPADFSMLAERYPQELAALVRSGALTPAQLTFAGEAIGRMRDPELALALLRDLAVSPSALVREGAIYGLELLGGAEAGSLLQRIARDDPAQFLRDLADDTA